MKRLSAHRIGIAQGDVQVFSDFESDGPMWAATGPREVRLEQRYDSPFAAPPSVSLGVTLWDFSRETNTRAELLAEEVGTHGFNIVFRTWGDTRVARLRVGWLAIGPLRDDDDWDVP